MAGKAAFEYGQTPRTGSSGAAGGKDEKYYVNHLPCGTGFPVHLKAAEISPRGTVHAQTLQDLCIILRKQKKGAPDRKSGAPAVFL